jgi:3-phenylpropionate/trans-cinnamate dioxygenase ferredoxin reductase subunit
MDRVVVVGASLAGLRAAEAVREQGHDGALLVVGEEEHPPYTRPPLSKQLLAGEMEREKVDLRWGEVEAEWRLGVRAEGVDPARRRLALAGGEELEYDGLVVATGCRPRPWPRAGQLPEGVFMLRRVDDALALRAALLGAGRLIVVGAGFIGCEVAATARSLGVEVVLCDIAQTPMPSLGPELGAACAGLQLDHGVELVMGRAIEGFEGDGRLERVRMADGTHFDAEVALVALGAVPNIEWLQHSGLDVSQGLVCDATCAAVGHSDVVGAGDVAAWPHPLADGELVRVEHWSNAAEQGALAGANLVRPVGHRVAYDSVPAFWSDQYDVKVQSVGFPARAERVRVLEGAVGERRFVAAGERDGRLVAAVGFNAARRMPWYRRHIAERAAFDDVVAAVADDERALPLAV